MKEIRLSKGKVALIDDEDYMLAMHMWYFNENKRKTGYAQRDIQQNGKILRLKMHRVILEVSGEIQVDHINENGLDNRRSNLRLATHNQNEHNSGSRKGTSKYKGVSYVKRSDKWLVQIMVNRQYHNLGTHYSEEIASHVYDFFARKYHGEFARLNHPRQGEQSALVEQEIEC